MSQTSYSINQGIGQSGGLADLGPTDFISAVAPNDAIPFGVAVAQATDGDNHCKLPTTSTEVAAVLGVTALVQTKEQQLGTGIVNYPKGSDIAILRKGRMYVKVEEAVTPGSPVFVRYATGAGGSQLGSFRMSADTASAAQLSGADFRSSAVAGGIAIVEVNFPR